MNENKISLKLSDHFNEEEDNFLNRKHTFPNKPIFKSTTSLKVVNQSKSSEDNNSNEEKNQNERQGRWLQSEHFRFLKGCLLYGNNWGQVKDCVKTRSSAQIRSHAQKYLIKLCKKYKNHPYFSSKTSYMGQNYSYSLFPKEDYILEGNLISLILLIRL